jgi:lysophospholipase L1-like esterase
MMKTAWSGLFFVACCVPVHAATGGAGLPAQLQRLRVEGRAATGADGRIEMGFPGVTLHLRCRGTALGLALDASNDAAFLDVLVDGLAPVRLRAHAGPGTYPLLPAGIAPGEHVITVVRRNESWQGTLAVLRVEPGVGTELLDPPAAPNRRLLFIGDSVTGGEIAAFDAKDPLTGKLAHNEQAANARLSYGYVVARQLGAECHLVSYGGRGVIRDWQGIRATANAPQFYELARPDDPTVRWDHARYVPDAVGVALGTNDFNQGVPDQNEFVNAYVELLRKIRRDAPHAWIFLLESPILVDAPGQPPKRSVLRGYLERVVAQAADERVRVAPIGHYPGLPGNGHPVASEHAAMADELRPLVQQVLHW